MTKFAPPLATLQDKKATPQKSAPKSSGKRRATQTGTHCSVAINSDVAWSGDLGEFLASMPISYRMAFSSADAREHAAIAARRGLQLIHVELWRTHPSGGATLCVVAEDRPALLSLISAGLVEARLDVTSAEIFCRTPPQRAVEAVDLFWVRGSDAEGRERAIEPAEVVNLSARLNTLLHDPTPLERVNANGESIPPLDPIPTSRVFFEPKALDSGLNVLVVESRDRPGLLLSLVRALHRQGLDIVASEIRTEGHHVRDRFTIVDSRSAPLTPERRDTIEAAMHRVLRLSHKA